MCASATRPPVAGHHHALAGKCPDRDKPLFVDGCDLFIIRRESREAGHIADASVRIMRLHEQPLRNAFVIASLFGKDDETLECRFVRHSVSHSFPQPADEELIGFRTRFKAETAFVREGSGWLLDNEAFLRSSRKYRRPRASFTMWA